MVMRKRLVVLICGTIAAIPCNSIAKDSKPAAEAPPATFKAMIDCRSVADSGQRLACYDRAVETVAADQAKGNLVVTDREHVREAKRGLFGLGVPDIKLFGGESIEQVETTLTGIRTYSPGQLQFTLANGSVWNQIDTTALPYEPSNGAKVLIKRAALGSFVLRVNNFPGVRVRRIR